MGGGLLDVCRSGHGELHGHAHALKLPYSCIWGSRLAFGSFQVPRLDFHHQNPGSLELMILMKYLPRGDVEVLVVEMYRLKKFSC